MRMLSLHNIGLEVSEVQKLLSLLGYDLVMDGNFDSKTLRSLNAFQKKSGLKIDGQVTEKTLQALKAAQKNTSKEIKNGTAHQDYDDLNITKGKERSSVQYIKQTFEKKQIFIHFAFNDSPTKWDNNKVVIPTAFLIEDGSIYETFNADFWTFHLGIKGTNGKLDKISIGIQVCISESLSDEDSQLELLGKLIICLAKKYNIKIQKKFDKNWFDFNQEVIDKSLPGIYITSNIKKDTNNNYKSDKLLKLLNTVSKTITTKK